MRIFSAMFVVLVLAVVVTAQGPQPEAEGTLNQVMRGILFPASNVIFDAQDQDPEGEPNEFAISSGPRRPYEGVYGGWEAVENAAIAIGEAANLLEIPGRECSNGQPVPLDQPNWAGFVQGLRDAAAVAYEGAQSRSQDEMLNVADVLVAACGNCHDAYREVPGGVPNRCRP
jgi:cytochrome c553